MPAIKKPAGLIAQWTDLVHDIAARPPLIISGVRKIVQGVSWRTRGDSWLGEDPFTFKDLSYSGKDNKVNQLERIYYNDAFVQEARSKIRERLDDDRSQSSVGIIMRGEDKDRRSQGHCIQNIVLTHAELRKGVEVTTLDVYYRSTEVVKKFLADVLFLKKVVFPRIMEGLPWPTEIRFYFCNVYLSALFMPIYLRYAKPPKRDLFEILRENDERFFGTTMSACGRFFEDTHNYTYRERVKMYDYTHEHLTPDEIFALRVYCRSARGIK